MIRVRADVSRLSAALGDLIASIGPASRHLLYSAAANAVRVLVRSHVSAEAASRHNSAAAVGGTRTGHLSKGARAITFTADDRHGEVVIPIPGISRAYHDLEIVPMNSRALTIPVSGVSYGHRAAELAALGWQIFRPKGKDSLFGTREGKTVCLYALKKRVRQQQDPTLLPDDNRVRITASQAMVTYLQHLKKAS